MKHTTEKAPGSGIDGQCMSDPMFFSCFFLLFLFSVFRERKKKTMKLGGLGVREDLEGTEEQKKVVIKYAV